MRVLILTVVFLATLSVAWDYQDYQNYERELEGRERVEDRERYYGPAF